MTIYKVLTGANPGHSYTVKSPSSFSSSDVTAESECFSSSLFLKKINKIYYRPVPYWKAFPNKHILNEISRALTSPWISSVASDVGNGTSEHSEPISYLQAEKQTKQEELIWEGGILLIN